MEIPKIIIITTEPFPYGMAATNRIITYAKGFKQHGVDCKVLCIKPTETAYSVSNEHVRGEYEGIPYHYTCKTTIKPSGFIKRRFINLKGILNAAREIRIENINDKKLGVINYTSQILHGYIFYFISAIYNIQYLKEESEHPFVYYNKYCFLKKIWQYFYVKKYYKLFDGILVISNALMFFFLRWGFEKKKLLHVPMTVDSERFKIRKKKNIQKNIVYSGYLNNKKDGVNILLEAFKEVIKIYPNLNLKLVGEPASDELEREYKKFVNIHNLTKHVDFIGKVTRDKMSGLLVSANVLVLPRPQSVQAQYGFPTKLGEYLASGNPVVCTKVGEISNYLTDGEDAYLCEPDSSESLREKIILALENPSIGKEGAKTAITHFNPYKQTKKILEFITTR